MFYDKDMLENDTPFFLQSSPLSATSFRTISNLSPQRSSHRIPPSMNKLAKRRQQQQQQPGQCPVHIIGDYYLYSYLGGQTQTMNYLAQVVSGVDVIYKNNFQSVSVFKDDFFLADISKRRSLCHSAESPSTTQPIILIKTSTQPIPMTPWFMLSMTNSHVINF